MPMPRAATWARTSRPVGVHGVDGGQHPLVVVGRRASRRPARSTAAARSAAMSCSDDRPPRRGRRSRTPPAARPCPSWPSALGDADQLVVLGGERRRVLALDWSGGCCVRDVVKPSATGARRPRRPARPSSAISSAVGRSVWSAPRSPMACRRSAAWGTWAAKSMSWGRRSSASRYSPKLCHAQSRPSCSAVPGMSSTPSISSMRRSRSAGRTGREADAAVAHHDGGDAVPRRRQQAAVPGGLAVVVGVDVDEARA